MADLGHKWCPKCESLLKKCKSFAQSFGGVCLNETFEETLNFVCCQGHQWGVNHKKFESSWCPECQQQEKELFKKKCEEERKRREKAQEEYQQKLFEEARRKAMQGSCSQPQTSAEDFLAYFQKADLEVEAVAKKDAEEYMAHKDMSENVSFQQALQVYKILIMPEDILEKYMMSLSPEILKGEFRRMAKAIHPDKNKHPRAGNAFQKVHKVYEVVISKFERS